MTLQYFTVQGQFQHIEVGASLTSKNNLEGNIST